jgi:methylglutaconyl-CoA hydratase
MTEYIKTEIKNSYAIIEFFHPSHNSLHSGLLNDLKLAIEKLEGEDLVKCILLKSGGERTFCAGANFDEMKAINNMETGEHFFSGFGGVINAMKNSSKLIIGRVQGKAVGGGVGLISACDIAFSTKFASIRLSELSIGIGPFVIAPAVERKLGLAGLTDLTLHPLEWKDAYWAKQNGMYSKVFETTEHLDDYVNNYMDEICSYSKKAIIETKKMLWHNTENWDEIMTERAKVSGKLVLKLNL